jgi:hypothetical protein
MGLVYEKTRYTGIGPNYGWEMNFKLEGYNECLITYVMASSPTHPIAAAAYHKGWAEGAIVSGASQYGIPVILIIMELRKCRPHVLVALFLFRSGSFHLKDQYADYWL